MSDMDKKFAFKIDVSDIDDAERGNEALTFLMRKWDLVQTELQKLSDDDRYKLAEHFENLIDGYGIGECLIEGNLGEFNGRL